MHKLKNLILTSGLHPRWSLPPPGNATTLHGAHGSPAWAAWVGLLLSVCCSVGAPAHDMHLRAMRNWVVVVGADAIPSERYAAAEFCRLYQAATGIELPTAPAAGGRPAVYIGTSTAAQAHPLGFAIDDLGEEGLRIRIADQALLIAGGRPRGTLYGVYEFFERYIGVRFLTRDHTHIPPGAADMAIPLTDYRYVPPFSFRWPFYAENHQDPEFAARLRVNTLAEDERLGGKSTQQLINHSMRAYVPVEEYGLAHPEYFALIDGVRKLTGVGGGPLVCSTNPDVIRIVTAAVERTLDANPALVDISVSAMDNDAFCECPECSALSEREGSRSAPHLALVNAVAARIAQSHPGVLVGTLAYRHTRKPPRTMRLLPNVEIMLCDIECCILHPLNDPDCPRNRLFLEEFSQWRKLCPNIRIWHYNTNFRNYDQPFPNFNTIAKNIQLFQDNGVRGVFMQASGDGLSGELSDLRNYVMANCLWRPARESWDLVEEFCRLHYGAAAQPILDYMRYLHQWTEVQGLHPRCSTNAPHELGLDRDAARRFHGYFQQALALAAGDDTIRRRVEKASIPVLRTLLATAELRYENGRYAMDTSCIGPDIPDRYMELAKKFGMNRIAEGWDLELYFAELQDLRQGLPAALLENQVWRLVVLPEQDGCIAEMIHKPTGRNLAESPVAGFTRWDLREPWPEETRLGRVAMTGTVHGWESDDRQLVMTRTLADGSVWRRTVSLPSATSGDIHVQVEFTASRAHAGFQVRERAPNYAVGNSGDSSVLAIYTRSATWSQVNREWGFERYDSLTTHLRPAAPTAAIAFYDHAQKFGIEQIFAADAFPRFQSYWNPGRRMLSLNMLTPVTPMEPGGRLSYAYVIRYLDQPPAPDPVLR
jgi:hypothetical protein